MLKLSPRTFAAAAVCLSASVAGGDVFAQLTQTPAPPRQDTLRTQDDELSNDSRAGGALSQDTAPGGVIGVEREMVPPRRAVRPVVEEREVTRGEGAEIAGDVVEVAENRLVLSVRPAPRSPLREMAFQVADTTVVVREGEPAELMSLVPGDRVRIVTAPGDSRIAVRIIATEELTGTFNTIEGIPNRDGDRVRRGRMATSQEEAVLPLGVEVYAAGQAALVTEMLVGGPAENGGVRIGDLIVAINGEPIRDPEKMEQLLAARAGGAELTIVREGQRMTVTVAPARVAPNALVNPVEIRRVLGSYGAVVAPVGVAAPVDPRDPGVRDDGGNRGAPAAATRPNAGNERTPAVPPAPAAEPGTPAAEPNASAIEPEAPATNRGTLPPE